MASGTLRAVHVTVLHSVVYGNVRRGNDYEYHVDSRARHVSEAVYMLEAFGYVTLGHDGSVSVTPAGTLYLVKRLSPFTPNSQQLSTT
jgi:hypothetical protein